MTRHEIIEAFKRRYLQADIDPIWSNAETGDIFQESLDYIWEKLIDFGQEYGFYLTRQAALVSSGVNKWALPTDFYRLEWLQDSLGTPIFPVTSTEKERVQLKLGFVFVGNDIQLVNYTTFPTAVYLDYFKYPVHFADYAGVADANTPEAPLADARGGLLIASAMIPRAKMKDGATSQLDLAAADKKIFAYVNRLGGRAKMGPRFAGV